jgi:hypothetical protein
MPWNVVANNSEVLAIHAALIPTNEILFFGGSEHNQAQNQSNDPADVDNTRLFKLDGGPPLIETVGSPTTDVFCSGHAFLADGRLLVGGGTEDWSGGHAGHGHGLNFLGEKACWVYLPRAKTWRRVDDLNVEPGQSDGGGRWYPTLGTLANGNVLAVAGHPTQTDSRHNNDTPERYAAGGDFWTTLTAERLDQGIRDRYYPRFHLLPDGNVFFVSPVSGACRVYNPFTGVTVGATIPAPGGSLYNSSWDFPSVLLPLLPPDGYKARVLACGDVNARRIDLSQSPPTWQNTTARTGSAAGQQRRFACAVLLPTGDVFVSGGIDGGTSDSDAVRDAELYSPGINWSTGQYTGAESWTTVEAAAVARNYHSTALLMPNGRVWTAGSSKNAAAGDPGAVGELRIEVWEPPYDADPGRPDLADAPASVGYGQTFQISCPQAAQLRTVAVTRCGATTHAFDGDQRYVALAFRRGEGDVVEVDSPPNSGIAPPGYYLLWVIDEAGLPCKEATFVRICPQRLQIILDRSTFSTHEVQALGTPAVFANAIYIVLDGSLPSEVGSPPVTPTLTFSRPDGSAVPGMAATLNRVLFEDDTVPPDVAQRVTFVFNVRFTSLQAFNEIPAADPAQPIVLRARHGGNAEQAPMTLSKNPNPYMRDGQVHWLSTDLRVFKARPGLTRAGVTHGTDPVAFIQQLLGVFDATPTDEDHPFFDIPEAADDSASQLELANQAGGQPVFNYAVAKVRYRAPAGVDASDVRVFFRLFTSAATGLAFTQEAYPRQGDGAAAAPLLGLTGGEILSIPFFAEARQADMRSQVDATNRRTIAGSGAVEVTEYFGCWLDFNQTTPRFPLTPPHNGSGGSFGGTLLSIQQLVRNHHCCLAAEIHYPLDPIPSGATPGSHDNLSQRNLVVVDSDNPGTAATHTVQTTFEVRPSAVPLDVPEVFERLSRRVESDELMFRWNDLPRESHVTLYIPSADAGEIVAAAAARNGPPVLTARAHDTLFCRPGDVTYVPLPGPRQVNIPGLLSVELPPTVKAGERFTVSVHQISGRPRRIIGSFQLTIPVVQPAEILPIEVRKLSVLRHIGLAIPAGNRWRAVWDRLLEQIGDRVRGLGEDPDEIEPSPTGEPGRPTPPAVTGKVGRVLYDRFGDFEGFVLETDDGEKTIHTCRRGIEEVVVRACRDGLRVTVWFTTDPKSGVGRMAIDCC